MNTRYFISLLAILATSCTIEVPTKPGSNGKTCEIAVVCNQKDFEEEIGDALRGFFMQEATMLNQSEPLFSLAHINPKAFNNSDMFKRLRNLIIININDTIRSAGLKTYRDSWASNQIVFIFNLPSKKDFFPLFEEKKILMLGMFYQTERERMKRIFKTTENISISAEMRKKFGFKLICPEGFRIGVNKPDVLCVIKDAKDYSQTIIVSRYPYTDKSFTQSDIIANRNRLAKAYIHGGVDSSYMTTETLVPPISREINFLGKYAVETKGLWRMVGDFMGGPFQNYVFVDEDNQHIIMIDAFLYSPRKAKRDLMMQLEGIVFSFTSYE